MNEVLKSTYGNKLRLRVNGLCRRDGKLLLVNHQGLTNGDFWAPPGGGVNFLESASDCLIREFAEETGLQISVGRFLFACEYIRTPLHAVELFFEVHPVGGELTKGDDPELSIISDVRFLGSDEVNAIPRASLHGVFSLVSSIDDLMELTGFFRI